MISDPDSYIGKCSFCYFVFLVGPDFFKEIVRIWTSDRGFVVEEWIGRVDLSIDPDLGSVCRSRDHPCGNLVVTVFEQLDTGHDIFRKFKGIQFAVPFEIKRICRFFQSGKVQLPISRTGFDQRKI